MSNRLKGGRFRLPQKATSQFQNQHCICHTSYALADSIYIRSVAEMQTVSISSTSWECSACIPIMISVNVEYVRTMFLLIATKEIEIRNAGWQEAEHTRFCQTVIFDKK